MRASNFHVCLTLVVSAALLLGGPAGDTPQRHLAAQEPSTGQTQLGEVRFEASGSPAARQHFLQGLRWLHSFEYAHARRAFQRAQEVDPDFAMAYWGEAMTHNHPVWYRQDTEAGRAALDKLGTTLEERLARAPTEREEAWLRAIDVLFFGEGEKTERDRRYAEAMARLHESDPDDHEAAAFYALAILGAASEGRDVPSYMRAAAVVEEVFRENPRHPGAVHYLIHAYDDPVHAPLGLRAARVYAEIAPDAVHALHMPSHIFLALGQWDDVVATNQRSADAAEAGGGVSYHALHWLGYAQLQQGRFSEAGETLRRMRAHAARAPTAGARYYLARARANYFVELADGPAELTREVLEMDVRSADTGLLGAASDLYVTALAALQNGDLLAAAEATARIRRAREQASHEGSDLPGERDAARVMERQLEALLRLGGGEPEAGLAGLWEAAEAEAAMRAEYGPPVVPKPSHELLGDVLLALGRPAEAAEAYGGALEHAPGRALALLGLARATEAAGDDRAADRAYGELAEMWREAEEVSAVREVRRRASDSD